MKWFGIDADRDMDLFHLAKNYFVLIIIVVLLNICFVLQDKYTLQLVVYADIIGCWLG